MYKADKTKFTQVLFIAIIISILSLLLIINQNIFVGMRLRSSIILILVSLAGGSTFLYIFIRTLYYEFKDKYLVIGSFFRWLNININYENIQSFDSKVTLVSKNGIYISFGKRFFIGKGNVDGIGKTKLYVTNSKKSIYIMTNKKIYAVSPKDFDGFKRELRIRNIKNEKVYRKITKEDILKNDEIAKRFFLLNFIIILVVMFIPIALDYFGYMPNYIPRPNTLTRVNLFISLNEYLNKAYITGILNFIFLIIITLFSIIYSKIDTLYHYKVLYIPLAVAIFRILFILIDLVLIYGRI